MNKKLDKILLYTLGVSLAFSFCSFFVLIRGSYLLYLIPSSFVVVPITYKSVKVLYNKKRSNKKYNYDNNTCNYIEKEYKNEKENNIDFIYKTRLAISKGKEFTNEERFAKEKEIYKNIPSKEKIKQLVK